jgi:hypothetical protein
VACGEMGLNLDYFYSLTPREFNNILEGYRKKEETYFNNSWEQTRLIAFNAAFNFETKDKGITAQKWMPLPWEQNKKELKPPTKTKEELKSFFKKFDEQQKTN